MRERALRSCFNYEEELQNNKEHAIQLYAVDAVLRQAELLADYFAKTAIE
jgi:hypothetical protein